MSFSPICFLGSLLVFPSRKIPLLHPSLLFFLACAIPFLQMSSDDLGQSFWILLFSQILWASFGILLPIPSSSFAFPSFSGESSSPFSQFSDLLRVFSRLFSSENFLSFLRPQGSPTHLFFPCSFLLWPWPFSYSWISHSFNLLLFVLPSYFSLWHFLFHFILSFFLKWYPFLTQSLLFHC